MVHGRTPLPVVILRQPARAARIAAVLESLGLQPYALPLTDTELPPDVRPIVEELAELGRGGHRWLILTSGNAVGALVHVAGTQGMRLVDLVRTGNVRVAAVGPATERLLEEEGVDVHLVPAEPSAAGLLSEFPIGTGSVLLPQADLAAERLRAGLQELGWWVRRVEAYRTVAHPADPLRRLPGVEEEGPRPPTLTWADFASLLAQGVQPAVVFTAPSTVRQFREMLGDGPRVFVPVAIGGTTAAALRLLGWEPGATAKNPTPQGVARAVLEACVAAGHPRPPASSNGEMP